MNFKFWERIFYLAMAVVVILLILCKALFDLTQQQAYFNHIKVYSIGGFMRTVTYIGKLGIKFQIWNDLGSLNTSNYYRGTFFDSVVMNEYSDRMMINLMTITSFLADQQANMTIDNLGNSYLIRYH